MRTRGAVAKIRPQQDVQAALTVLGRRNPQRSEHDHLRLSDTYLVGANLRRAHLRKARLRRSESGDARFEQADLRSAKLGKADLSGADLGEADLRDAKLTGATLTDAKLKGAHLSGVIGLAAPEAQLGTAQWRPAEECDRASAPRWRLSRRLTRRPV